MWFLSYTMCYVILHILYYMRKDAYIYRYTQFLQQSYKYGYHPSGKTDTKFTLGIAKQLINGLAEI